MRCHPNKNMFVPHIFAHMTARNVIAAARFAGMRWF
jgi:hypothetical protein